MNNVVLVHGGFVDGSGWGAVYKILRELLGVADDHFPKLFEYAVR